MIRTLLVDDEYPSLKILENFTLKLSECEVVAKCSNAAEAVAVLEKEKVDLMFLDIQMPGMTGIDMLKKLPVKPVTIITTANHDMALDAFNLDVVDYLVKPFSFERFNHAMERAKAYLKYKHQDSTAITEKPDYIMVKSDYKIVKIFFKEIKYIEGLGEYVKIILDKGNFVVTLEALKNLEKMLPSDQFIRIHKSYILNTALIRAVSGNMVSLNDGSALP
ncbi:MAG: response regulator transcription factor, partial [Bacteroidetes bacterium]|nr:response regulator transcription factor [Bacteroidota bacterium]